MSPEIIRDERLPEPEVLKLIREVAYDQKTKDEVTVLPLMCGTGKSTSISYLIKDAIEKNEGLVVMTDRIARFDGYLKPRDPELKEYLQQHIEQITVMTKDKMKDAYRTVKHRPVLLVTTQHYYRLSRDSIISQLLTWDGGIRPLIIIDEKPELYKDTTIDVSSVGTIESAILELALSNKDLECRVMSILTHAVSLKAELFDDLLRFSKIQPKVEQYSFLVKPHFDSHQTDLTEELEENITVIYKKDMEKWNALIKEYGIDDPDSFFEPLFYEQYVTDMMMTEFSKNASVIDKEKYKPLELLHALIQMRNKGALYCYSKNHEWPQNNFAVLTNNREKLDKIGAKVVILDGTADLSLDYRQEYLHPHMIDCSKYRRKIPNLHIHIVNAKTSKTTFLSSIPKNVIDPIKKYVEKHESCTEFPIFTHKVLREWLENEDPETIEGHKADHLGDLRGKNGYIQQNLLVQIGILLCQKSYYVNRMVDQRDDAKYFDEIYNGDPACVAEQIKYIDDLIADPQYDEKLYKDALADIEQNVFRSPVRTNGYMEPVSYYLFFDTQQNEKLVELIQNRFISVYGATVDVDKNPAEIKTAKMIQRKGRMSDTTIAQKIYQHIDSFPEGTPFTPTKDILVPLDLNMKQWEIAKRNEELKKYIEPMKTEKKGHYIKR